MLAREPVEPLRRRRLWKAASINVRLDPVNTKGDPSVRRPAMKRAQLLAEAGVVARALEMLLKRASFGTASAEALQQAIAREESRQLQKAHGRIEARKRFKALSSHPLLEGREINNLYLDEGGKSAVEPLPGPTFFALGGIAMADNSVAGYCKAADKIKLEFFGTSEITFHEPVMRLFDGPYYFNGDQHRQAELDRALEELLENTEFFAFGVGVRKHAFEKDFSDTGIDPYLPTDAYAVAITMLLERYVDFLAASSEPWMGRVTFESQGTREDAEHQLEYARLLLEGTQWISDSTFRNWLEPGLRFATKQGSSPCELADMFSRELYEWIRGDCDVLPKRWDWFARRVYCRDDGMMGKFGVKVFPDSDIRDRIEKHRRRCIDGRKN